VLPADLSDVVIELTEDDLFSADTALDLQLEALRARGARIAVDDAGAGYAGLQQLIRIKPDILKLDRSLVQGVHADDAKIALLEALSRFAVTTGAAVCGEGIEEVDELRTLARLDVTYAQGYALARPGPAWPEIDGELAAEVASADHSGMRVAQPTVAGPPTIGEVTEAIARVRSLADLNRAMVMIETLTHADDVALSRVLSEERCVETLSEHHLGTTGDRFTFDDYPTTERVILDQVIGQVVQGDPAADPAELAMLRRDGFGAVLLTPVLHRAETIGLLEFYRSTARPWTPTEIDQARMLAHHLGSVVRAPRNGLDEWSASPDASWLRELAP
jgi:GAF domain-containing protein